MEWTPGETPAQPESRRARRLAEQGRAPELAGADELAAPPAAQPDAWSGGAYVPPNIDDLRPPAPPAPSWTAPAAPGVPGPPAPGSESPGPAVPGSAAPDVPGAVAPLSAPGDAAPGAWAPPPALPPAPPWEAPAPMPAAPPPASDAPRWDPPAWEPPAAESPQPASAASWVTGAGDAGPLGAGGAPWPPPGAAMPAPPASAAGPAGSAGPDGPAADAGPPADAARASAAEPTSGAPGFPPPAAPAAWDAPVAPPAAWQPVPAPAPWSPPQTEAPAWSLDDSSTAGPDSRIAGSDATGESAFDARGDDLAGTGEPFAGRADESAPPPLREPDAVAGPPTDAFAALGLDFASPSAGDAADDSDPATARGTRPDGSAATPVGPAGGSAPTGPASTGPASTGPASSWSLDDAVAEPWTDPAGDRRSAEDRPAAGASPFDVGDPGTAVLPSSPVAPPVARADAPSPASPGRAGGVVPPPPSDPDASEPVALGTSRPLVDFGDLAKPRPFEWIAFALAFLLPPVGLVTGIVAAVSSVRHRGWTIALDKATIVISLVTTAIAGIAGVVGWQALEDARRFDETVAASAEFCAQATSDPAVLAPPLYSWPQRGDTIPATIDAMRAFVERWDALATVAPGGVQEGVQSIADRGRSIMEGVEASRQIDNDQAVELMLTTIGGSGVDEWVATYCEPGA